MRVVVVGAGIMGCATALELALRGVKDIVVLERAVPGAEASSAAAGMLAAQVESTNDDELRRYVAAREAYPAFVAQLAEVTGLDVGYRRCGVLEASAEGASLEALRARVATHRALDLRAEIVDRQAARAIEPALSPAFAHAAFFPDEAQVEPARLLRALAAAIARRGVSVRRGTTVASLRVDGDHCRGVTVDAGETIEADAVVLAAGSWSSLVPGVPTSLPKVRPIRGQLVMLDERPPTMTTILFADHAYVVPRGDGRVVCGSTMEDVGHRREVTARGVHAILGSAIRIAPSLGDAELVASWSSFRPHVDGSAPLVGASSVPGLFLATGHHRNGILLAPATGRAVAEAIVRDRS